MVLCMYFSASKFAILLDGFDSGNKPSWYKDMIMNVHHQRREYKGCGKNCKLCINERGQHGQRILERKVERVTHIIALKLADIDPDIENIDQLISQETEKIIDERVKLELKMNQAPIRGIIMEKTMLGKYGYEKYDGETEYANLGKFKIGCRYDAVDGTTIIENKNTDCVRQSHIIQVALYAISSNGKYDKAKIIFNNGLYELSEEELASECEKVKDIAQKLWDVIVSDAWLDIFND
jgi:hypothetical protein